MPRRIPCLDGLRAIAIAIVVASHVGHTAGSPDLFRVPWSRAAGVGGVALFFVLSGYLITTLLLGERARNDGIGLKRFWARRALRLLPACYAYLLVVLVMRQLGIIQFGNMGWFAAATYWGNHYHGIGWPLEHTWSLSVEEQFYLFWPLLVAFLPTNRIVFAAAGIAAGWPLLRLLKHGWVVAGEGVYALETAGMDSILWGCLLAIALRAPGITQSLRERTADWMGWPLLAAPVALYLAAPHLPLPAPALPPLRDGLYAALVAFILVRPESLLGRVLDVRPLRAIGILSYSLYLWQQLFLHPTHPHWMMQWPQNLVLSVIAAVASYYLLERPLLALRARLAAPKPEPTPTVLSAAG